MPKKLLIALSLSLLACSNGNSDTPPAKGYIASGVIVSNVIVSARNDGASVTEGSIVRIVDGCRVLYVMGGYLDQGNNLSTNFHSTTIAVSDIDCKK